MSRHPNSAVSAHSAGDNAPDSKPISRTSKRRLAAALLAVFIGGLDLTVIATILPRMIYDLNVNTADIDRYIWVVNGYLLAYTVAIPIVGRISDLVGRRLAFLVALTIFVAGSLWCAVAQDLGALIIGRTVQGLGGGALLPITMALVGDLLPPNQRTAALGLVGAVDTLGWVLGPIWGAAIVTIFGSFHTPWRIVFYINVPFGIIAAVAILLAARGSSPVRRVAQIRRLDVIGTILLAGALAFLNLALSSGGEIGAGAAAGSSGLRALGGTSNPLAKYLWPFLIAAAVLAVAFLLWERRASLPIIPLRLFRIHTFTAAILANFAVGAALIVAMVDVPLVVALVVNEDRVSGISALMLLPFTLLMALLSLAGGIVASRFSERLTTLLGLLCVVIGYVLIWLVFSGTHYVEMLPGLIISGAGFGLVIAPIASTVINASPEEDLGISAGLTMVFRLLGMTIGISTLTAFGVRRLQDLTSAIAPVTQKPNESTADFLLRQQTFIEKQAIPASIQVTRETFLIAAGVALIAIIPVWFMHRPPSSTVSTGDAPASNAEEESRRPRSAGRADAPGHSAKAARFVTPPARP